MGPLKKYVNWERREGRLIKKETKSDVGGEVEDKKCDATHFKNDIMQVMCFLNDAYDVCVFCCIFHECIC